MNQPQPTLGGVASRSVGQPGEALRRETFCFSLARDWIFQTVFGGPYGRAPSVQP